MQDGRGRVRGEEGARPLIKMQRPYRKSDLAAVGQLQFLEIVVDARDGVRGEAIAEDRMLDLGVQRLAIERGEVCLFLFSQANLFCFDRRLASTCDTRFIPCRQLIPSPHECNRALAQDTVIKYQGCRLVRHAEAHMEWQQVLLTGMTVTC